MENKLFNESKKGQAHDERIEYILCAANHYIFDKVGREDGSDIIGDEDNTWLRKRGISPYNITEGIVLCGWRHGNIIAQMNALTGLRQCLTSEVQGFLTSKNRFVDRKEGGEIAFKAGQTSEEKRMLFSEDIY